MGLLIGTLMFILIVIIGVFSAPVWAKSQLGLVRVLVGLGVFCCWLSWVLIYMAQMNPLLLPTRIIHIE